MPLAKIPITLNFGGGIDTKTDSHQVSIGKFLALTNSVYTTTGRLTKRNGFGNVTTLPNTSQTTLTTLGGNLLATGSNLYSFSQDTNTWIDKGLTQPVQLSVKPIVRNSTNQTVPDSIVASNGLACTVFLDGTTASYVVTDTATGDQVISETSLPATAGQPHVFILGKYFIITFIISPAQLQYIAIPIANPSNPTAASNLASDVAFLYSPYDCVVINSTLYFAWQAGGVGTPLSINFMTSTFLIGGAPINVSPLSTGSISLCTDAGESIVWLTFWDSGNSNVWSLSYDLSLNPVTLIRSIDSGVTVNNLTTVADDQLLQAFYEITNTYSAPYPVSDVRTDYIRTSSVTQAGSIGTASTVIRSVGLASKAFLSGSDAYMLVAYGDKSDPTLSSQPSYFLITSSGQIVMRLAYSNGGGFSVTNSLPNVSQVGTNFYIPYLIADFLATVNKGTNLPSGTPTTAIYTQTGINMAIFGINVSTQFESEIAGALHLTGGQLWEYDGVRPVEHGFHLWPENIQVTTSDAPATLVSYGMSAGSYQDLYALSSTTQLGVGVSFTPSSNTDLTQIKFIVNRSSSGADVGSMSANVYSDSGSLPDTLLGTSSNTIMAVSLTTGLDTIVTFTFSSPLALTSGTPYWFTIETDATYQGGSALVYVRYPTSGGNTHPTATDGSGTWAGISTTPAFELDSNGGGNITTGNYFYAFTYEWTDNAGNLHRSAPSIPFAITTTGSASTNTCYVPTLRLTAKIAPNKVRIVGYRWSVNQPIYYQFTSITSPVYNDTTIDYVTIVDTASDAAILGQTVLYTTGGVIENIAAPASIASALCNSRLVLIDAEDPNVLWYSKPVIENTPVEMSNLLTLYVAPTTGAQGSTGPMTAVSAMDDKTIIFKNQAIYYITGKGPDITGAQNDFSDPIFITSSVGCTNPNSIVLMPNGIMFQSDKGIWLLDRGLGTKYIGADVEAFNSFTVKSATVIPGTTEVRFILDNGVILMYDYYYNQWGDFTTQSALSSTLYQGLHTYLNKFGQVFQETPGIYLDGSSPVLMSFTTGWINAAGLRGFERFYDMYLLGTWYSPFKLDVLLAYDFNPSPIQSILVTPDNYSPNWGGEQFWGTGQAWGGPGNIFQARVAPKKQKCQTFQVTVNELYDPSYGAPAGQGVSLSGFNIVIGAKLGYPKNKGSRTFG